MTENVTTSDSETYFNESPAEIEETTSVVNDNVIIAEQMRTKLPTLARECDRWGV